MIHQILTGCQQNFLVTLGPIPAIFFEGGMSIAEFNKIVELEESEYFDYRIHSIRKFPLPKPHQKIVTQTVEIGNQLTLDVEGPLTHAVMWGDTIR